MDFFLDLPLGETGNAVTAYTAFYDYDYGPNLIRNIGVNNIATAGDSEELTFNGPGNRFPVLGTGHSVLIQAGYFIRAWQLQPYFSWQASDFERLSNTMVSWNLGAHKFFNGQKSKLSVNLENRPIFVDDGETINLDDRKFMFVVQYQLLL